MQTETKITKYEPTPASELATQPGGVVRLADKLDHVVEAFREYQSACEKLLVESDYQSIQGKKFKKKSAWRKIATAFNISTRIVSSKIEYDEDDHIHHAEFVVQAFAPNGRVTEAWAGASVVDRDFSHDQDVAATAQTRATSRAIADLIGAGEVSAEEMASESSPAPARQAAPPADKPVPTKPSSKSSGDSKFEYHKFAPPNEMHISYDKWHDTEGAELLARESCGFGKNKGTKWLDMDDVQLYWYADNALKQLGTKYHDGAISDLRGIQDALYQKGHEPHFIFEVE